MTFIGALIGVGSEAPSTALRAVPLSRYRGGGKKNYPTLRPIRLAIRLRWICDVPAAMVAARASR